MDLPAVDRGIDDCNVALIASCEIFVTHAIGNVMGYIEFMNYSARTLVGAMLALHVTAFSALANEQTLDGQRAVFIEAEKAFAGGQSQKYKELKGQLADYPLLPYLEYDELTRKVNGNFENDIVGFLERNADSPLAERLRYQWMSRLAKQRKFDTLVRHFRPTQDTALECTYREALLNRGETDKAMAGLEQLWLVGKSQPSECDPVFRAWQKTPSFTDEIIWQRISLAMRANDLALASYLARSLPEKDRQALDLWQKIHRDPSQVTRVSVQSDNGIHRSAIVHGVLRLAYRDLAKAMDAWQQVKDKYSFSLEERNRVRQTLGLLLAQNHQPEALQWLTSVDPEIENDRIREWRVRTAIMNRDWIAVLAAVDWLDKEQKKDERWQYWRGRALESLGFNREADAVYRQVAETRNFFSFLAADRVDVPYSFENRPVMLTTEEMAAVERVPGIMRASELFKLNRMVDARREWEYSRKLLDENMVIVAAKVAQHWGWHSSAIFTAAQSGYMDDIPMRFPLGHQETILVQAKSFNIEPEWVYGILRQESAFVTDARSGKGALGLMQIMPSTGAYVAKKQKTPFKGPFELLSAEKNIKLGSAYLRDVRNRLYDHPVLATAAYNAGYTRVKRWLPQKDAIDADLWIETLPYDETRDYIERVMAYTIIYDWRLNASHKTLKQFMPPIIPLTGANVVSQAAKRSADGPT